MKLISWNVNGIRSCLNQGLEKFFKDENPDFCSIQEIKCNEEPFKPIILCGDFNSDYENTNLSFLDENKDFPCNLIDKFNLIDTFRVFYPNEKIYTWKSIKNQDSGSRIDYFFISDYFSKNLENAKIYSDIKGSDHFPIGISFYDIIKEKN